MRPALASLVLVTASAVTCFALSAITNGDPLILVEVAGGFAVATWASTALVLVRRSAILATRLATPGAWGSLDGVRYKLVPDAEASAFVAGGLRPSVFVTTGALAVLSPDELRAVVLHEAHHARTLAPVRASLVEAWSIILRHVPIARRVLSARLDAIEIDADRFALRGGASRRHLASALLKLDGDRVGVGYAGGGDGRLRALLRDEVSWVHSLPVEWSAGLMLIGLTLGCYTAGTTLGV